MKIDEQLLKQARQIVLKSNNYSPSHLQRKLEIGYNRAVVLIEIIKPIESKAKKRHLRLRSKKNKRLCCVR